MRLSVIIITIFLFFVTNLLAAMTRDEAHQKALSGDVKAMFALGVNSYKKMDSDSFYAKDALYWFKKSAEKGYAPAQSSLAMMYHYGEGVNVDYAKFIFWAQRAAENDNTAGKIQLVLAYLEGHGVEQNYTEARRWLLKSNLEKNRHSQYLMGYCHELGLGFPLDLRKAYKWYAKSQSNGNTLARVRLDALCKYSSWACK